MLEYLETLNSGVEIRYDGRMWHISVMTDHGMEQTLGKKFEDALEALKLRLA